MKLKSFLAILSFSLLLSNTVQADIISSIATEKIKLSISYFMTHNGSEMSEKVKAKLLSYIQAHPEKKEKAIEVISTYKQKAENSKYKTILESLENEILNKKV